MSDDTLVDMVLEVRRLNQAVRRLGEQIRRRPTRAAELLSPNEISRECRVSPDTVRRDIHNCLLPCVRRPYGRKVRLLVRRDDANRFYAQT